MLSNTTSDKLTNPEPTDKGHLNTPDGLSLRYRYWLPTSSTDTQPPINGLVVIVHGFGEHGLKYAQLVKGLLAHNYAVFSYDHRGHGRSDGQRGHISSWSDYRNDLTLMLDYIESRAALTQLPLFMYAHSMGALIGLEYIAHYPLAFKGSIISAAPLKSASNVSPLLIIAAKSMSAIAPKFSLALNLEVASISNDPEVLLAYEQDPFKHNQSSARWGTEILNTIQWVKTHARQIISPILLLHGEGDRISQAQGSQTLFTQIGSVDKTIRIYPNGLHQSHNDSNADEVIADVVKWLALHL